MTNNLGRTNVVVGQSSKEVTIAASDDALDAAITGELTMTWSGAEATKTVSTAQTQSNFIFTMDGSTSEGAPELKFGSVQRGLVLVKNNLSVDLLIRDYSTSTSIIAGAGETVAVYVSATSVVKIFQSINITLPDSSVDPCRVATTGNITIATALNDGDTLNGVTLADGDRVLVWKQTTASENGIWIVDATPYRALDFDEDSEVTAGTLVVTEEGTSYGDALFMLSTNNPITVDTTSLTFKLLTQNATQYASAAQTLAGTLTTRAISPARLATVFQKGSNTASATTLTLGNGRVFYITGTTDIEALDYTSTSFNGREVVLEFDDVLTLVHSASLVLPGADDIATAAGDRACFIQFSSGVFHCLWYTRADGTSIVNAAFTAASTTEVLTAAENGKAVTPLNLFSLWGKGSDTASAGTMVIGEGGMVHVTGTTTITDVDFDPANDGRAVVCVFDDILTLTHNGTSLQLPGEDDIVTAAGDRACFIQDSSDNVICLWYTRKDGTAVITSGGLAAASTTEVLTGTTTGVGATPDAIAALWEKGSAVASAATLTLGEGGYFHVTGTTGISDIDWATAKNGRWAWLTFDAALTITHSSTLNLPGAANITTAAGDRALFIQDASDTVYCMVYTRADGTPLVGSGGYTDEDAMDAIAAMIAAGTHTGISFSYNDAGDALSATVSITQYTDEMAQDAINSLIGAGTHDGVSFSYNDAGNALSVTAKPTECLIIAIGDETTAATAGTAKVTFRMPYAFTLTAVRASCVTAPTGSVATIDINESGVSILSTKLTIDASEKTSTTAATAAVISDANLADDAEMTIDMDGVGSTVAGAGYKVYLIGHRT